MRNVTAHDCHVWTPRRSTGAPGCRSTCIFGFLSPYRQVRDVSNSPDRSAADFRVTSDSRSQLLADPRFLHNKATSLMGFCAALARRSDGQGPGRPRECLTDLGRVVGKDGSRG
jgi:hypothetical protein